MINPQIRHGKKVYILNRRLSYNDVKNRPLTEARKNVYLSSMQKSEQAEREGKQSGERDKAKRVFESARRAYWEWVGNRKRSNNL